MITIEKNVPLSPRKKPTNKLGKYTSLFEQMEVGDSFVTSASGTETSSSRVHSSLFVFAKQRGWKVIARRVYDDEGNWKRDENGCGLVRSFRIA